MLPKFKNLIESGKQRQTAYLLSTNLIGGLDEAAIREGRFDEKVRIYPPDALSRMGRLLTELAAMGKIEDEKSDRKNERIEEMVKARPAGRWSAWQHRVGSRAHQSRRKRRSFFPSATCCTMTTNQRNRESSLGLNPK